ncbi:unnamed protein product [Eruca vesicaria subsp. sativa]|uniref:Flowering time control protein FCA n=1 Tax=Eruca vesicaria subsp. sativa TaxID=29727 RepID=A0ABC8JTP1_ERUVS|nr:unnamed protein product [Eruca vesicaria subsp. sativa]
MERRVTNSFPGPPPPQVPYYHHQIHPPPHHHVSAVGFHQYPQNDNRDQRFNQPQFDNHYPAQQQQQHMIVDGSGSSSRKRRSLSSTPDPSGGDGNSVVKLYVAPVPMTATEYDVRQVFEKYGSVTEIIFPKDKMSGDRAAYCFVKYRKLEEGSAAIASLTEQFTFPGEISPVKVRYADAERERIGNGFSTVQLPDKLYVRCLSKQTTRLEVHEVFSRFGIIEDIYMAVDDMKISRGFAFVQFARREMALEAIKALNGLFTMRGSDQPLIVRFADPKKPRLGEPRFNFNAPPSTAIQLDPNWHPQPYPQWGNKEPAAPRVVHHHDIASHPNRFPQQNGQAVSEVHKPLHQQDSEKHQKFETVSLEKISSNSNALPEDQNTENSECDWSEHTCPDGNKYYFHCITGESTWEKPEEYSMFERWYEEQTRLLQDQKSISSPQLNNQRSQGEVENSEQIHLSDDLLQQTTTKLQQPSLSTTDQENNKVCPVLAVETTCS